jgi:hypothetical protein
MSRAACTRIILQWYCDEIQNLAAMPWTEIITHLRCRICRFLIRLKAIAIANGVTCQRHGRVFALQ